MKRGYVLAPLVVLLANSAGAAKEPDSVTPAFQPRSSAEFLQNPGLDLIGLP